MTMADTVCIAAVQMNPVLMQPAINLDEIIKQLERAASKGARIIAFPECCLTGYNFSSRKEAVPFAVTIPGEITGTIEQ